MSAGPVELHSNPSSVAILAEAITGATERESFSDAMAGILLAAAHLQITSARGRASAAELRAMFLTNAARAFDADLEAHPEIIQ